MKHVTLKFLEVTAGLYQQEVLLKGKKDALVKMWSEAVSKNDTKTLRALIAEIKSVTTNNHWLSSLTEIEEELSTL